MNYSIIKTMISKRLLGCRHSDPMTSRVIIEYDHKSQFIADNAISTLFKVVSRTEYDLYLLE